MLEIAAKFSLSEMQRAAEKEAIALGYDPKACVFSVRVSSDGHLYLLIEHIRASEGNASEVCCIGEHILTLF